MSLLDAHPDQIALMHSDQCILVDEKDNVIGHASKVDCHRWTAVTSGKALHRAFSVFLFDGKNRLLLQQRAAQKITFPMMWTNTCCSHPLHQPDELDAEMFVGVRRAAQRKLNHELGIKPEAVPIDQMRVVARFIYQASSGQGWGEHERMCIHPSSSNTVDCCIIIRTTGDGPELSPNDGEVAAVQWVDRDSLGDLMQREQITPWFRLISEKWLGEWWDGEWGGDPSVIHWL